jgi:hypothetical protein
MTINKKDYQRWIALKCKLPIKFSADVKFGIVEMKAKKKK